MNDGDNGDEEEDKRMAVHSIIINNNCFILDACFFVLMSFLFG